MHLSQFGSGVVDVWYSGTSEWAGIGYCMITDETKMIG